MFFCDVKNKLSYIHIINESSPYSLQQVINLLPEKSASVNVIKDSSIKENIKISAFMSFYETILLMRFVPNNDLYI